MLVSASEFIHGLYLDQGADATYFIDGLDEARAQPSDSSVIHRIRSELRKLGKPKFRISCRAADWLGASDRDALKSEVANFEIPLYALIDLDDDEIANILGDVKLAQDMISSARTAGADLFLRNPHLLELWSEVAKSGLHATTKTELFQTASGLMARERREDKHQRNQQVGISEEKILTSAGQLCATLLLSDLDGIAVRRSSVNRRFPELQALQPLDMQHGQAALGSLLFKPAQVADRLVPAHRTIAEFLAAQWMAQQIDQKQLSLTRIRNLLLGNDNKPISSLRGLYGWLTTLGISFRQRLILDDPISVAQYGDPATLPVSDKTLLLNTLLAKNQEIRALASSFDRNTYWGQLWDESLQGLFIQRLADTNRSTDAQHQTVFLIRVLQQTTCKYDEEMLSTLWSIAADTSRWQWVRGEACTAALKHSQSVTEAIQLLRAIESNATIDVNDELAGILLQHLYPDNMGLDGALKHLHQCKDDRLTGTFSYFWDHEFAQRTESSDLPRLIEHLLRRDDLELGNTQVRNFSRMATAVLGRAFQECGDHTVDDVLYRWMHLCSDEYGTNNQPLEGRTPINAWFADRPNRYKSILRIGYNEFASADKPRMAVFRLQRMFEGIPPPSDLGIWHLELIDEFDAEPMREVLLGEVINALAYGRCADGLNLDALFEWASQAAHRRSLLLPMLSCQLPEWHFDHQEATIARRHEREDQRRLRTERVAPHLPAINDGSAPPNLMHHLAQVWYGHFQDIPGDNPESRFESYAENHQQLLECAKRGFLACMDRNDLPSLPQVIKLRQQKKVHFLVLPTLVGTDLLWAQNPEVFESLPESKVELLCGYWLSYGLDKTPAWYMEIAPRRSAAAASALITFVKADIAGQSEFVTGFHELSTNEAFTDVARQSLPEILLSFPSRSNKTQLQQLETLIKIFVRRCPADIRRVCTSRLARRSLDKMQRLYWITLGSMVDAPKYEQDLLERLGSSELHAQAVASLLSTGVLGGVADIGFGAKLLARLIEILGPIAQMEWPSGSGWVTDAMRLGDTVRAFISSLTQQGTREAVQELARLENLPSLQALKPILSDYKQQAINHLRERNYRYADLDDVVQILRNAVPANPSDLKVMAIDLFGEIAHEIRNGNDNYIRNFWKEASDRKGNQALIHVSENTCRDLLLSRLQPHLDLKGITCIPEAQVQSEKRVDIMLSKGSQIDLPIEIKGQWNPALWTGLTDQLDHQYTKDKSQGHGIYLVLWTGESNMTPPRDGGRKPSSPSELTERLTSQMQEAQRARISVVVLDISFPT
ncbi:hypothetical protein [Rhodoferax sp. GW822-FHT02A01]|uniref:hypothetical protein n=1 Tax=Rhodoferax sp. GW822-FHT02A01 TaxID=3141537 RepID=UPI00315DFDED